MGVHSPIFDKIENIFGKFPKPSEMNGKEKIMNEKNNKKENQRTQKKRISFRVDDDELKFIQAKMKVISMLIVLCFFRKIGFRCWQISFKCACSETEYPMSRLFEIASVQILSIPLLTSRR